MEHDGHTNKRHPLTQYLSLQTVTYIFSIPQNQITKMQLHQIFMYTKAYIS